MLNLLIVAIFLAPLAVVLWRAWEAEDSNSRLCHEIEERMFWEDPEHDRRDPLLPPR